jgi:hypothetical protein
MAEGFLSGVGSDPAVPRKVTLSIFSLVYFSARDYLTAYHPFHRSLDTVMKMKQDDEIR